MRHFSTYGIALILVGMISFLTSGCDKTSIKPETCKNGKCDFNLLTNSAISITEDTVITQLEIIAGNNLVFEYEYEANEKKNIADDEYFETILFEIHPDSTTFSFTDGDLQNLNAVFRRSCFCPLPFAVRIEKGTISGMKEEDGKWRIEVDVEIDLDFSTINRTYSQTFKE